MCLPLSPPICMHLFELSKIPHQVFYKLPNVGFLQGIILVCEQRLFVFFSLATYNVVSSIYRHSSLYSLTVTRSGSYPVNFLVYWGAVMISTSAYYGILHLPFTTCIKQMDAMKLWFQIFDIPRQAYFRRIVVTNSRYMVLVVGSSSILLMALLFLNAILEMLYHPTIISFCAQNLFIVIHLSITYVNCSARRLSS